MLLRVWCKRRRRPRVVRHRIGEAHRSILESTSNCTSPRLTSVCARGRRGLPSLIMGLLSCKSRLFKLGSIRWFGCNYTSSGQVHNIIAAVKFNIKSPIGANRSNSGGMVSMLRWVPSQHFLTDAELRICCLAIPYRKDQLSQHLQKVSKASWYTPDITRLEKAAGEIDLLWNGGESDSRNWFPRVAVCMPIRIMVASFRGVRTVRSAIPRCCSRV